MRRREFLGVVGGAAFAWPLAARAQEKVRRVGVLMGAGADEDDLDVKTRMAALVEGLERLGWVRDRNVQFDLRVARGDADAIRRHVADLAARPPDVIVTSGAAVSGPMLQATRTASIVFTNVVDPVGADFVESMARPGGNATGFAQFEYSLSAKWLEVLKEIAPNVRRVAVVRDASITAGVGQFAAIQTVAPALGVELTPVNPRNAAEMERLIGAFARSPDGALIVTASATAVFRRDQMIALAAQHKLPAMYPRRLFTASGGLLSYGPDIVDQWRRAAGYVDRILKGEKPADLPVQAPTRYELIVNMKTAKALGLTVPPSLLARADEVIE